MSKKSFLGSFSFSLVQWVLPCNAEDSLFEPRFYGTINDKLEISRICSTAAKADADISFAGPNEVQFSSCTSGEHYLTVEKILKQLNEQKQTDLLVIHLEKRFDYWMKPARRREEENKIIEFGKQTAFKRCLILIDCAFGVGVLKDFRNEFKKN